MDITSAKNVRDLNGEISNIEANINGEAVCVPLVEGNRHYQAILEWVAEGNTIEEDE